MPAQMPPARSDPAPPLTDALFFAVYPDAPAAARISLGSAMTERGLGQWVKPRFTPHLALLRDRLRVAEHAVDPIAWTVREFVLVHSARGANGRTEHVLLGRWPMRG